MKKKVVIWFLILSISLSWFAYYSSKISSRLKANILGVDSVNGSPDLNYSFNLEWNFNAKKDWKIVESGNLKLENWQLYSSENWLKQRISIWKTEFSATWEYKNSAILNELDIISDNSKLYFNVWEWKDRIISFYEKFIWKNELTSSIKNTLDEKKYVMFDNSKPILRILWDLSKNELIKNLAVSISTSNPEEYLKKLWSDKELKTFLSSDKAIDLIFKEWKISQNGNKINLLLNEKNCKTFIPLLENITKEIWSNISPLDWNSLKDCEDSINEANKMLPMITQIYKEWDLKSWNFKFVMVQGNLFELNIDYKNHIIEKWSFESSYEDKFSISVNWDKDKIISSLLKLNIDEDWVKVIWEIKDWEWKIDINWDLEWVKINWFVKFSKYLPSEIDISGNWKVWYKMDLNFSIKWNYESWKMRYSFINPRKSTEKFIWNLEYWKWTLNIDFINKDDYAENLEWKFNYKDWKFSWIMNDIENKDNKVSINWYINSIEDFNIVFESKQTMSQNRETLVKSNLSYIWWKVKWDFIVDDKMSNWMHDIEIDIQLNGYLNSITDFDLKMDIKDKRWVESIILKWKELSKDEVDYYFSIPKEIWNSNYNEMINFNLNIKSSQKNWFEVKDLVWRLEVQSEKISADFNLKYSYKNGWVEYKIPTNFKEIDIKLTEMMTLPNMNLKVSEFNKEEVVLAWTTIAWLWWTIAFISLQWYSKDARNSKVISDMTSLTNAISVWYTSWIPISSFVKRNINYEWKNIYIWWNKVNSINYIVWTPNYEVLWIKKEDFLNPLTSEEYLIWVTNLKGWKFEILGKLENNNWNEYHIIWNYLPRKVENIKITNLWNNTVSISSSSDINKLYFWDKTNLWLIKSISLDLQRITLDSKIDENIEYINLLSNEPDGLIFDENWKPYLMNKETENFPENFSNL